MRQLIWYNPNTTDEQPGQFTRTDEEQRLSGWFWVVGKIAGTIQPAAVHNGMLHIFGCSVPLKVEEFHVLAPLEMDLTTRQADLAIAEAHLAGAKQITIDAPDLTTSQLPFSPLVDMDDEGPTAEELDALRDEPEESPLTKEEEEEFARLDRRDEQVDKMLELGMIDQATAERMKAAG